MIWRKDEVIDPCLEMHTKLEETLRHLLLKVGSGVFPTLCSSSRVDDAVVCVECEEWLASLI